MRALAHLTLVNVPASACPYCRSPLGLRIGGAGHVCHRNRLLDRSGQRKHRVSGSLDLGLARDDEEGLTQGGVSRAALGESSGAALC